MRVTSDGDRLGGFAHGQHSSEETSGQRRAVADIASDLTGQEIETQIFRTDSVCLSRA